MKDTVTQEELNAYFSESKERNKPRVNTLGIPRLRINSTAEDAKGEIIIDAKGKPLGAGSWQLDGSTNYAKVIKFLPIMVRYQYTRLTKEFKLAAASIYFKDSEWNVEPLDSAGGVRCGRPSGKALKSLPLEKQNEWRKIVPADMHVFGLAFFGDDKEGVPCDFKVRGNKFKTVSDVLKASEPYEAKYFELSLEKEVSGAVKYFNIRMEPIADASPNEHILVTHKKFLEYVNDYNETVVTKHKQIRAEVSTNAATAKLMDSIIDSKDYADNGVVEDLNDDFPEFTD